MFFSGPFEEYYLHYLKLSQQNDWLNSFGLACVLADLERLNSHDAINFNTFNKIKLNALRLEYFYKAHIKGKANIIPDQFEEKNIERLHDTIQQIIDQYQPEYPHQPLFFRLKNYLTVLSDKMSNSVIDTTSSGVASINFGSGQL